MKPVSTVRYQIRSLLQGVHSRRADAVFDVVEGILSGSSLCLSEIGRNLRGPVSPKHNIKKVDRLLSNHHLFGEISLFAAAQASMILDSMEFPIILVDWTKTDCDNLQVLSAAVAFDGRAIPLYSEAHRIRVGMRTAAELDFLDTLSSIVPEGCCPIIVTDTGFGTPWFDKVSSLGWHFLGRVGSNPHVASLTGSLSVSSSSGWLPASELMAHAPNVPTDLGGWLLSKARELPCRLVLYSKFTARRTARRRNRKPKPNRKGVHAGSAAHQKAVRRARTPWLLATSLPQATAAQVVKLYSLRMQIEETFRDAKSHRFGWSLEDVRTESHQRLSILIMLCSIAMLIAMLTGVAAEMQGLPKAIQANTIRSRRVLSLFFLGTYILSRHHLSNRVSRSAIEKAMRQIDEILRRNAL